jgi:hypothetical protein
MSPSWFRSTIDEIFKVWSAADEGKEALPMPGVALANSSRRRLPVSSLKPGKNQPLACTSAE